MKLRSRRGKRQKKFLADERFATKVIVAIGVTTVIFIAAQYVSFLITGIEQTTLITYYFTAVVIECGALMLKRLSEIIVARVKKKEKIEPETETDESEVQSALRKYQQQGIFVCIFRSGTKDCVELTQELLRINLT